MSIVEPAAERIAALCRDSAADAPEAHRERLVQLGERLLQPLHVAVAGRVKSGKSTFVNALLGQRVARTDARECTRVVTWFRYGPANRVTVIDRDGVRHPNRLDADGLVPEDLGLPLDQVAAVDVELTLARLKSFTLADTPGLDSPDEVTSKATEGVLGIDPDSHAAIAAAEAVLFVMNQTVRQSDVDVLRAFRALARGSAGDVISAFGVLNKADLFDGLDPMATGAEIAERFSSALHAELAGVFACSSLFAELALCGVFTETDAHDIETLANLDADRRERMLLSESTFCRGPSEVSGESRRRLWGLLREAGLRTALSAVDAGRSGAVSLREHLLDVSGHRIVEAAIGELFEANAAALKASAALDRLESMAWSAGGAWGEGVRDRLEALRLDPALHVVAEIGALRQVRRGDVALPADLAHELAQLVATPMSARTDGTHAALRRWRTHANSAINPTEAHVARVVVRSYELAGGTGRTT